MKILYLHKNKLYVDYIQIIPKIHLESTKNVNYNYNYKKMK